MADIQFDEEQQYQRPVQTEQKPFFIRLVLATKIVSTDARANYVLLGIALCAIILAFLVPSFMRSSPPKMTPEEQQRMLNAPGMNPRSVTQ
ncbi:MAG: hypothetical protein ABSB00_01490 [Minisyncoccia bacterium]|jgi:hypothetical protein